MKYAIKVVCKKSNWQEWCRSFGRGTTKYKENAYFYNDANEAYLTLMKLSDGYYSYTVEECE